MKKQLFKELLSKKSGLLCNHTSWDFGTGSYFFEELTNLHRIFIPEHGLFAELQDQIPVRETETYNDFGIEAEIVSLYGEEESSLAVAKENLQDLEVLFVDLQDVGSRYFTYAVTLGHLMKSVKQHAPDLAVVLIDRENPAGLQVEGTKLPVDFSSFIGWTGLPHRYGLTLAELGLFFYNHLEADFPLYIFPLPNQKIRRDFSEAFPETIQLIGNESGDDKAENDSFLAHSQFIPPSPNIPGPATPFVYSGQCLLEGTNLSEGRGTTRPFEQFGAPYLKPLKRLIDDQQFMRFPGITLRPIRFVPTFHKWKDEICEGFQVHLKGEPYHSLLHSLYIIRTIRDHYPDFKWREGSFEFGSDKTAIELLAGDRTLLNYLNGEENFDNVKKYLHESEKNWLVEMAQYKIYDRKYFSVLH